MGQYSWNGFVTLVLIAIFGLYVGISTKASPKEPNDIGYILRRYAKVSGYIAAVGCSLAAAIMPYLTPG
jgi:hypothetical protein